MKEDFFSVSDHFDALVKALPAADLELYQAGRNIRIETAYRDRQFVIYEIGTHGGPVELDRVTVLDYHCWDTDGSTSKVVHDLSDRHIVIGHSPVQLFDHPIMVWIPLHAKTRWSASPSMFKNGVGSLAFPLAIRTLSRRSMREKGVVHCETGPAFGAEFNIYKTPTLD